MSAEKGGMTVSEAGKKGGKKTRDTHGHEFYQQIGRMGGETTSREHGPDFYQQIGHKGGVGLPLCLPRLRLGRINFCLKVIRQIHGLVNPRLAIPYGRQPACQLGSVFFRVIPQQGRAIHPVDP